MSRIGRRKRNKNRWKGRYNPEDCVGTGKNGAIPEPGRYQHALRMESYSYLSAGVTYLCPGTENISPCLLIWERFQLQQADTQIADALRGLFKSVLAHARRSVADP